MSLLGRFAFVGLLAGAAALMPAKTEAAVLTINDGTDVWSLDVSVPSGGCTTCAVTLQVVYGAASVRIGTFLDSVEWNLTSPNVGPVNAGSVGFTGFIVDPAGPTGPFNEGTNEWNFSLANLNANQCGGGSGNSTCGAFVGTSVPAAAGGYGPITGGLTLQWTFLTTFSSPLTTLQTGNIRAAYNTSTGSNAGIFSPGGGTFGGSGGSTGQVPEPASLMMLGIGALGLASRMRRRK
jgi:hypothetical protein